MSDFQSEKKLVLAYYDALENAPMEGIASVIQSHTGPEHTWRAYHPFHAQTDAQAIADVFWTPFRRAIKHVQRRMDVFFAGHSCVGDETAVWVCSMGHLMGLFDAPWLGIKPTGKIVMLRYAEFNKVVDGKITETAFYFDIPHLMMQAGYAPFGVQTAAHLVQPGPAPHSALLFEDADVAEGQKTLDAINAMITDLGQWKSGLPLEEELRRTWHENMIWWGPAGIGASYTIPRYAKQHSAPFRAAFGDRSAVNHIARVAEGEYGGFFGWPNFTAKLKGPFMGLPASDTLSEFRVIDMYRRDGDKLMENWIFIDMLHFFNQQGVDVLAQIADAEPLPV